MEVGPEGSEGKQALFTAFPRDQGFEHGTHFFLCEKERL